ncbi:MAG: 30S ribosomal protein S4 [Candidatus Kerfeldbacteria bacterium CG08_land_8_20_14_0_20_43_14]|uniref:Small ribosomal subunit protein uS4 n=1 Tax=Candidatus Kerfeldbacteria bacterium CG08_land_8_20_14_0_20_43_14 TaxID=2014246 RepID=A0A2H0YRQ6_9BACT|nr:MAG: 30S ribosomal protein S4 [Candidatus Kerfeldbacteria bacterium CG08_land_8_20_14_0_20_43_14]
MARNLGPKHTRCRRYGVKLCDSVKCPVIRRPYPPGQHGPKGTSRLSEYGVQLAEKQKAKIIYGLLERQFENYFKKAIGKKGNTGLLLLQSLERRLDNVIYRLGFAATHSQARQFVGHGFILVNGKKVTIPSYNVDVNDEIGVANKPKIRAQIAERLKGQREAKSGWLSVETDKLAGKIARLPETEDVQQPLNMQLIVEYYSR